MSYVVPTRALRSDSSCADREDLLTRREREILQLIGEGFSNKDIARALYIEIATVKNHVHNILEKLEVDCRGQAAAWLWKRHITIFAQEGFEPSADLTVERVA